MIHSIYVSSIYEPHIYSIMAFIMTKCLSVPQGTAELGIFDNLWLTSLTDIWSMEVGIEWRICCDVRMQVWKARDLWHYIFLFSIIIVHSSHLRVFAQSNRSGISFIHCREWIVTILYFMYKMCDSKKDVYFVSAYAYVTYELRHFHNVWGLSSAGDMYVSVHPAEYQNIEACSFHAYVI